METFYVKFKIVMIWNFIRLMVRSHRKHTCKLPSGVDQVNLFGFLSKQTGGNVNQLKNQGVKKYNELMEWFL